MQEKIQIVLLPMEDWHYYVVREDGEFTDQSGPYPTEEECRQAASDAHPNLEFVFPGSRTQPQEVWPPQP